MIDPRYDDCLYCAYLYVHPEKCADCFWNNEAPRGAYDNWKYIDRQTGVLLTSLLPEIATQTREAK